MYYIIIFLTLPFIVYADQPQSDESKSDYIDINFYKNRMHIEINEDGHLWTPIMYTHSEFCPCKDYKD